MKIPIFQIDTFTNKLFSGNPAAVCPLNEWLPDDQLLSIAAENNLSETAFFVKQKGAYTLRWFSPVTEVDLCGHATLAAGFVILNHITPLKEYVDFFTKSGRLSVKRKGKFLTMSFPRRDPTLCKAPVGLINSLGIKPKKFFVSHRDYMALYDTEDDIKSISPDMYALKNIDRLGIIVTAVGKESDFVSRFFAPKAGIPEDHVTGSAHCTLVPYWAKQLRKTRLHAVQLSKRGGELFCELQDRNVIITGEAKLYLSGDILIS